MNAVDPKLLTPIVIGALVVFSIVRRLRRTFGRQPVQPVRLWLRIGILTLVAGLIVSTIITRIDLLEALITGAALGAALGYVGLRHTRFETTAEGRFYTPHTYIGLLVTVLFLGRFAYRVLYLSNGANGTFGAAPGGAAAFQSPLTLGTFAVLIGYYLVFYAGVLLKTRAADLPAPSPASPE